MELIDTHCHIQSAGMVGGERQTAEIWAKQPGKTGRSLVEEAVASGVSKMICVGCDLADSRLAIQFVQDQPACLASIGIHPHEAQHFRDRPDLLNEFAGLAPGPKVVAIGECGLDFYYSHSPKEDQLAVLRFQLELAQRHNLPLIFHVRQAFDEFWPVLGQFPGVRGVLHSFTDSPQNLERALKAGLYIGVNGIASFTKSGEQLAMYQAIPLDRLLLETDAPFLTPTPYRGKINEPKFVRQVAEFLSELRGETGEFLAAATTHNAGKLFGLL